MTKKMFRFNMIVAVDKKMGISLNNAIPWNIKPDTNYFYDITTRKYDTNNKPNVVVMGANTYKALGKSDGLPNRINIVVSSTLKFDDEILDTPNIIIAKSIDDVLQLLNIIEHSGEVFIIGGVKIYDEFLSRNLIDKLYINRIDRDYSCDNCLSYDPCEKFGFKFKESEKTFKLFDNLNNLDVDVSFGVYYSDANKYLKYIKLHEENQYLDMLYQTLKTGHFRATRNSATWSVFGKHMEFDLSNGFPMITTKKVFLRGIFEETMFFLSGSTDVKILHDKGVCIWDANTSSKFIQQQNLKLDEFDMGPLYPFQFRSYGLEYEGKDKCYTDGYDQIEYCLKLLMNDPYSRRIIMTAYNPVQAHQSVLFPCHSIVLQFYVDGDNKLSLYTYNRSQDLFLGVVWNILYAALLVNMFCEVINNNSNNKLTPGRLIMGMGDVHIYQNHYEQAIRQILRDPYDFPQLKFKRCVKNLNDFKFDDLELINYKSYPGIKADMIA